MSHDSTCKSTRITGRKHVFPTVLLPALVLGILSLLLAATAFANGSDRISGFPAIDLRSGSQYAKAMAVDSEGNIVVVGSVGSGSTDYFIAKFKADGSGLAWVPVSYGGTGTDVATAVAVDTLNNIVVTGYSWSGSNYDIHTSKYNGATGALLWEQSYNNSAVNGDDLGTALSLDGSGNVYVAGYSANGLKNDDFLLIKYPSAGGAPVWVELSDDTLYQNNINRFTAIAAGTSGIAVTGYSSKGGADFDIITRKYGFDGTLAKEWRYSSPGGRDDRGIAVKMDSAGYVAVTGYITNALNNKDIYTAKYYTASDTPVWERIFDNAGGSGNDEPAALWVDGLGDVFVTGSTGTLAGNNDIYTARYSGSTGEILWDSIYNAGDGSADVPVGIVVDDALDGGVFVTGYTTVASTEDFITLKYRKDNGFMLWDTIWNNTFNLNERPVGIALSSRNVVIAGWTDGGASGQDFMAMKYDFGSLNAPTQLTAAPASNTSITLRWADNSTNEARFVIQRKLGETGTWADIATITSPAAPNSVTMNSASMMSYTDGTPPLQTNKYYYYRVRANNTADSDSYYSNEAHALTKVVSYEAPVWNFIYDGADHLEDIATDITFDSDNHPVVTGYSDLTEEGLEPGPDTHTWDYMTFKLDRSNKSIKWKARYDSGDGGTDMAAGVALDSSGNVIVTGTAYLSGGSDKSDDLYTRKVQTSTVTEPTAVPDFMWEHQFGTQSGIDYATAISMVRDGSNNSVVLGYGQNSAAPMDFDIFLVKLDNNGNPTWTPIIYDSGLNDIPSAIALDSAGNIFVTGFRYDKSADPEGSYDWFTAKYNGATGTLVWSDTYNISGDVYQRTSGNDQSLGIDVDAAGNAYVTGYATNSDGQTVFYTVKYDGAQVPALNRRIWEKAFNYPGFHAEGAAVKVDPIDGAVVVAGTANVSATDSDFHLIRYNPADGSLTAGGLKPFWQINFDRPESYDYVTAMSMDSSGYIYVTGNRRSGPDTDPGSDATSDIMSLIYDYEGTFLGAMEYTGAQKDEATAITANYVGEAFIAGSATNAAQNPDYVVLKQTNGYLLVPAPFTTTSNADSGKIDLNWQHNNSNATFILERTPGPATPASTWSEIARPVAGSTSFTDDSLTSDSNYCYRITAIYNTLPSRKVVRCATTRLVPPVLDMPVHGADPANLKITLTWNQVAANTGYKIERKTGVAGSWTEIATRQANQNTYEDTAGLARGTIYYYRVSTNSPRGYSLPSNEGITVTSPVLNAPGNIANDQMTLTWDTVVGATSYTLENKLSGGGYTSIPACTGIAGTTCTAGSLTPLGQYTFRVKGIVASASSGWSNETSAQAVLGVPPLTAPSATTDSTATMSWTAVYGAATYTVEAKPSGGVYAPAAGCTAVTGTSCTATGLSPNTTYYFRIKASNASGDSAWGADTTGKTKLPTPVFKTAVGSSKTQVDLTWDPVPGATAYTVEQAYCYYNASTPSYCRGGDSYYSGWSVKASGLTTTTYAATGLTAGNNYRYRITATVSGNTSSPSSVLHAWTYLTAPTVTVTPTDLTSLTVSWDAQPGETNYAVERDSSIITTLPMDTMSYPNTGLQQQTQYCYRVKAYSTEPVPPPEAWSNLVCRTTPLPAPVFVTPTIVSTTQVRLDWNQIPNNTGYEVERCPNTDFNNPVANRTLGTCVNITPKLATDVNYYTDTVTAGSTNRYRVRAYYNSSTDWTAFSTEWWVTAKPPTPTLYAPTAGSSSQINLSWNNVYGDNGYSIFWKVRSGATCTDDTWSGPLSAGLNATSTSHTGLTSNTYYCYKIKANGPPGPPTADSDFSTIQTQTTLVATPTLNTPTGITSSNVCLSWANIMPNTGYKVERKLSATGTWAQVGADLPADNVNATVNWCNNSGLSSGSPYYYRVSIKNAAGYSATSNEQLATTTPAIPSITATTVSDDRIDVCWALPYGATSYRVDRKTGSGGTYGTVATPSVAYSTSYCGEPYPSVTCTTPTAVTYCHQDTGLTENTTYFYHVHSANGTESPESGEKSATTLSIASSNLTATPVNGGLMIRLDWTPMTCAPELCDNPEYFEIQRQVREGLWVPLKTIEGTATTYTDNVAIDPNCQYRYRIRSVKGALLSPYAEATVFAKPFVTGTNVCR